MAAAPGELTLHAVYEPGPCFGDPGVLHLDGPLAAWPDAARPWYPDTVRDGGRVELSAAEAVALTAALVRAEAEAHVSPGFRLLMRAYRLAARLVEMGEVLPFAAPMEAKWRDVLQSWSALDGDQEDGWSAWTRLGWRYRAVWAPRLSQRPARALRSALLQAAERDALGGWYRGIGWQKQHHARIVLDAWLLLCVDQIIRRTLREVRLEPENTNAWRIRYRGEEALVTAWQTALTGDDAAFSGDAWLVWRLLRNWWPGSGWSAAGEAYARPADVCHLELVLMPPDAGTSGGTWWLRVDVVHEVWKTRAPLMALWMERDRRLQLGLERVEGVDEWAIPLLWQLGESVPVLRRTVNRLHPGEAELSEAEAVDLLVEQLPWLAEHGVLVRSAMVPQAAADVRIRVRVERWHGRGGRSRGQSGTGFFHRDGLVDFDWSVVIDGEEISREAFERLVEQKRPLLQLGGTWKLVPVQAVLEGLNEWLGDAQAGSVPLPMLLTGSDDENAREDAEKETSDIEVEWTYAADAAPVRELVEQLRRAPRPEPVAEPSGFRGQLRDYQRTGLGWFIHLRQLGLGGCLADDMGLGKTVQVIAYLLHLRERGWAEGPHLLVCPTSLIPNWRSEIRRFAPDLRVHVHHGAGRLELGDAGETALDTAIRDADVVITTYATAARDVDVLRGIAWDVVIADEAQNIKNGETKQARAMRALPARQRLALTGTPMENRLEELWSIMHFVNPGYLGSLAWFRKHIAQPITVQSDTQTARRLQQMLRPVLLRRTKTDPHIQLELPEKWEVREYAGLTPEQAALYQGIVDELFQGVQSRTGMARRGQILAALVRLKQVCDHPCLVVGGRADPDRSAKLRLLLERLEEVISEGERALVFTQFRDMGDLLCDALAARFGFRPRFLHGGQSSAERGQIVEAFQTRMDPSPVLILSLKAGGVGLNLTEATHVFHYDRWWNPAVEDQATDRVYRIGQTRNVQVHKLVCAGTLEERIDELITAKRRLSAAIVGTSEAWLTELDDETLRELFELDKQAAEVVD